MVLWLIGISGAGKTAIGKEVYQELKKKKPNIVFLDGDLFREVMGEDLGHTVEERRKNGWRIARMCKYLNDQNIDVVCAHLSLFEEHQRWNRKQIKDYYEVYVKVSLDTVIERDPKGLYEKANSGKINNMVGIDIDFPEPKNPDLVIENDVTRDSLKPIARRIINKL